MRSNCHDDTGTWTNAVAHGKQKMKLFPRILAKRKFAGTQIREITRNIRVF